MNSICKPACATRRALRPIVGRTKTARQQAHFARRTQGGFTLIELVAAFVLFVLGFGILMQVLGNALHMTRQATEYTQAALWAQSLLDVQGIGEPLQEGGSSGEFDATYRWQMSVTKIAPAALGATNPTTRPSTLNMVEPGGIQLFQIELVVSWGNQFLTHNARFATLRAMGPPRLGNMPAAPAQPIPGFQ